MRDPSPQMQRLQPPRDTVAEWYILRPPLAPWGDYGDVLVHGMTESDARDPSPCRLIRTGPFVPPVTFPGIGLPVVTQETRAALESSGLTGLSFLPATKEVIVPSSWNDWDLLAEEPPEYPEDGEPESYLLSKHHDPELARAMPELWAVAFEERAKESRVPSGLDVEIALVRSSLPALDFFRAGTTLRIYVSPRGRAWLNEQFSAWVTFEPASIEGET
jgi:hypothetical protein